MSQIHINIDSQRLNITHSIIVKIRHYHYVLLVGWLKNELWCIDGLELCVTFNVNLLNKSYM